MAIGARAAAPPSTSPPNLLLVTLDTTRADRLGCYGYGHALTPILDGLAARGTLFEQALASCPLTLPSHATLLTGLQPPEHGLRINGKGRLDPAIVTLAEQLAPRGYHTGAFIAAFALDDKFGLGQGFQTYDDDLKDARAQEMVEPMSVYRPGNLVTDAALAWLERQRGPFFCWVHLYDAHYPYSAHPELDGTRFEKEASYDAQIAFVDRQVGRLIEFLSKRQLVEQTLVVVVGDHGEGLDDHGEVEHGYLLNQEALRVPLIVSRPGHVREGHRVPAVVSLVDVAPTLRALLDLPVGAKTSGRTLAPALHGEEIASAPSYAETDLPYTTYNWSPLRSLTTPRWKYIRTAKPELYDRDSDPTEQRNLLREKPDQVRELEAALAKVESELGVRSAPAVVLAPEERQRLEALGYVTGTDGESAPASSSRADIKDMLPAKHLDTWLRAAMQAGTVSRADILSAARKLVDMSPETAPFRFTLAIALVEENELDEAVTQLNEAIRLRPAYAEAQTNLGNVLLRQGKLEEAARFYTDALREHPDLPEAHLGMGNIMTARGDDAAALRHYREAIRFRPDYADAHHNLANLLARTGKRDEAIAHFREALRLKPDSAVVHHNLGLLLAQGDDVREAVAQLREAVRLSPGFASAQYNLGKVLAEEGKLAEAIDHYTEAVRLEPGNPDYLDNLAAAYAAAGRRDEAVRTAEKAAASARAAGRADLASSIERRAEVYRRLAAQKH